MNFSSVMPGTLDLLVLKSLSLGREHGYGILLRIQRASQDILQVEQGALYPALARLEAQGLISAEWGLSENNRRAKFYELTREGKARLRSDVQDWRRFAGALEQVLNTQSLSALS